MSAWAKIAIGIWSATVLGLVWRVVDAVRRRRRLRAMRQTQGGKP